MTGGERGSSTVEALLLMGLSLVVVIAFANLAVDGLVKGMAHSAADQGVRVGARLESDAVPACEDRARQVLSSVLAGPAGSGATVSCSTDGEVVVSHVVLDLPAWVPLFHDSHVDVTGRARKERLPGATP